MKMLTKLTKGLQITIPAEYRRRLGIDETAVLDIGLDRKGKRIVIEPIKEPSLKTLFAKWDKMKNKTKKSIKELEEDYVRENMLHGY